MGGRKPHKTKKQRIEDAAFSAVAAASAVSVS